MEVVKDIRRLGVYESSLELGITYRPSDLSFNEFLLFKWIKEKRGK